MPEADNFINIMFFIIGVVFFILGLRMIYYSFKALIATDINKEFSYLVQISFWMQYTKLQIFKKTKFLNKITEILLIACGIFFLLLGIAFTSDLLLGLFPE